MIKCAITLLTIATCIVGIFADDFCENQRKLDSECAKYCYQVAKPLLQMAPVCHNKDAEIKELNSNISKLVVFEEREKKCLEEVKLCKDLNVQLADLQNKLVVYGERKRKSLEEGAKCNELNTKLTDLQNKLDFCEERERRCLEEENKYNELNDKFIELNKKLAVYEYREKGFEEGNIELKTKIANLQNDLGLYKERERKSLEEGTKCNNLTTKLTVLQNKLGVCEEREKKSLEEGTKCNELNEKSDKQLKILLNLEEREKKDIEEINLNKQLNVQLGEVQEKLADCEEREKKSKENNSKAESSLKASLEEYRVKISDLESSNLALNISNQKLKEHLEQRYNYKWAYKNTSLTQRPGVDTTGSVEIKGMKAFSVRCVNNLNSGPGWMLIQKRTETLEDNYFYKQWSKYRDGFSYDNGGFFIGLEKLYRLTNAVPHELYIDMEDWDGNNKIAHYDNFRVGNESEQYRLKDLGNYTPDSNAGDALRDNNNMKFSTRDRDNDNSPDVDCSQNYFSGWWHNNCTKANLNGWQYGTVDYNTHGIWWHSPGVQLKNVRMLIRPKVKK